MVEIFGSGAEPDFGLQPPVLLESVSPNGLCNLCQLSHFLTRSCHKEMISALLSRV